jgi:hypothetical protein
MNYFISLKDLETQFVKTENLLFQYFWLLIIENIGFRPHFLLQELAIKAKFIASVEFSPHLPPSSIAVELRLETIK